MIHWDFTVNIPTLGGVAVALIATFKFLRGLDRWVEDVNTTLYGQRDPKGELITLGLVRDVEQLKKEREHVWQR